MWRKIKILIALVLFCFLTFKGIRAWERRNEGFVIENIYSTIPANPQWDVQYASEDIKTVNSILNQPFYYLGHGFQTYVFESEDGNYVVKFIRHQRLRLSTVARHLPDIGPLKTFKQRKAEDFAKRTKYLFNGFKVGYVHAKEDTAIVYVHLNKTKNLHNIITIYDKLRNRYDVELDEVEFIVQRKARLIKPVIDELMIKGDFDGAKARIDQIFTLLVSCAKRGILDMDGALIRKNNLGFLGERAIYIDSGKLSVKKHVNLKERYDFEIKRLFLFERWLRERHPELVDHFVTLKEKYANEFQTVAAK